MFLSALSKIGVTPNEAVYIGDNVTAYVAGSASVGMTPMLFGDKFAADCFTLMRWSEIDRLFDDLEDHF